MVKELNSISVILSTWDGQVLGKVNKRKGMAPLSLRA